MILGNDSLFWEVPGVENRSATHAFSAWSAFAASPDVSLALSSVYRRLGCSRSPWLPFHREER